MGKYLSAAIFSLTLLHPAVAASNEDAHFTPAQQKEYARIVDLRKQLDDALEQRNGLMDTLADLEQRATQLVTANLQLADRQAALLAAQGQHASADAARQFVLSDETSNDARASYVMGARYAERASLETEQLASIGKKLDLLALTQGFNDHVHAQMQLPKDQVSAELSSIDLQLEEVNRARAQKHRQALLSAAAKEKGALALPGGVIYRILDKGKAPTVTDQSDILFEFDEQLGTGEILASRESRNSKVKRLPPPFRTILKQLGLGGSAKIHIPIDTADDERAAPRGIPPGNLSIVTIKVIGIK